MTVDSTVYRAAATMTHSSVGWATSAILIGAMKEVIQIAIALMITTKKPIVENSSRPVNATRTGRAKRLTRTRTAAHDRNPIDAGAPERDDRHRGRAERERLADRDDRRAAGR